MQIVYHVIRRRHWGARSRIVFFFFCELNVHWSCKYFEETLKHFKTCWRKLIPKITMKNPRILQLARDVKLSRNSWAINRIKLQYFVTLQSSRMFIYCNQIYIVSCTKIMYLIFKIMEFAVFLRNIHLRIYCSYRHII